MNKRVSVTKRISPFQNKTGTGCLSKLKSGFNFGRGITSLQKAIAAVNASPTLSTEDLFKTLLMYHKPNQGWGATPRDPQFLADAIKNILTGARF